MSDYHQYVTALAHRKLAAWAFAVGERPRPFDERPHPRLHRGMLPDVDFDRAVPDPEYRSLFRRIVDRLWGRKYEGIVEPSARAELRAELTAALGEQLAAAYLGEDEMGNAVPRASGGNSGQNDWSRAA
jgi:hypothetical protein